jgi:mitochondrial ATPase complex subunit ATP10
MGLDTRTLRQRRDDFHDYKKHLERRSALTKRIAKPYFRDWSNMRFFQGKIFVAPERLFRADVSLWFPNFFGRTLRRKKEVEERDYGDGYKGLGRGTTEVMSGKVSVVSIVGNDWAQKQVNTFVSPASNPDLQEVLKEEKELAQRVEINWESNVLKWWLLQLFAVPSLRKQRSREEQDRYFMVRRGVSEDMKEAIGLLNDKGGYVYLVDGDCRIRWAGSAEAAEAERQSLVDGVRRLVREAKTPKEQRMQKSIAKEEEKEKLEATVLELTEEEADEKPKAAAAG